MELTVILPLIASVIGIVLSYYRIISIQESREKDRDLEWQKYVDKELHFIREIYNNQISQLNDKVDRLINMVEKLRDKDK